MTEMDTPTPLPALAWVAVLLPSVFVAGFEVSRELSGPAAPVPLATLALLWLFTTLPTAALVLAMRRSLARQRGPAPPPEVAAAIEAVSRAEAFAARSFQAQAQLHAVVQAQGAPAAPADMVPRTTARRTTLLACGLVALFLISVGAFGAVFSGPAAAPRFDHTHAAFAVWVEGQQVPFTDPAFDLTLRGVQRAHLRVGDGYPGILHLEGKPGLTLAAAFKDAMGATLAEDTLTLDEAVHGGKTFQENATHRLRLLVAGGSGDWAEVKPVTSFVPRDHDRLLISFGDERGAALAAQEASVPTRLPP